MPYYFRAAALDFDGTITTDDTVAEHVLAAVAELRRRGRYCVLCTGRILSELRTVFPEVDRHFDAIVAENGGVLALPGRPDRMLADEPPAELVDALVARGVKVRRGRVLLATHAAFDIDALHEIARLGLEVQLVRNRSELMLLPAGVSKATGLLEALGELQVSRHSTVAIGDAENDHALLHACEVGVAVGNAVGSLKNRADLVLDEPNGDGVAAFLLGPFLSGELRVRAERWQAGIGHTADGEPVTLPASRINILVAGGSGSGKSYVAGALVERLATLGYVCCVFDCEGDHAGIGSMRGIISVGADEPLPPPPVLARMIRNRFTSLIVDLSLLGWDARRAYVRAALHELTALRRASGLPHWIVLEEADQLLLDVRLPAEEPHLRPTGYLLVTHRPGSLQREDVELVDAVIALSGAEPYAAGRSFEDPSQPCHPFALDHGEALLALDGRMTCFRTADRLTPHVRHHHKYIDAQVPAERRFFFGPPGGPAAGNLREFCTIISTLDEPTLFQHLRAGDFSRWVRDVLADDSLGARLRSIERWFRNEPSVSERQARDAVISVIESRYAREADLLC